MSDTIEDIRARHATTTLRADGSHAAFHAHYDRATLLAEVDRLTRERDEARAEVERLRAEIERLLQAIGLVTTTVPDMQVDIENPVGMAQRVVAEVDRQRAEIERQARYIEELREKIDADRSCACSFDAPGAVCAAHSPALMQARAALRPFSELYLWPDDAGEWTANDVRSDEDWDEERNDANVDDVFIKRAHIRAARKALEAKP